MNDEMWTMQNDDPVVEVMRILARRGRAIREARQKEATGDLGGLAAASETEKDRSTARSRVKPILAENDLVVNS